VSELVEAHSVAVDPRSERYLWRGTQVRTRTRLRTLSALEMLLLRLGPAVRSADAWARLHEEQVGGLQASKVERAAERARRKVVRDGLTGRLTAPLPVQAEHLVREALESPQFIREREIAREAPLELVARRYPAEEIQSEVVLEKVRMPREPGDGLGSDDPPEAGVATERVEGRSSEPSRNVETVRDAWFGEGICDAPLSDARPETLVGIASHGRDEFGAFARVESVSEGQFPTELKLAARLERDAGDGSDQREALANDPVAGAKSAEVPPVDQNPGSSIGKADSWLTEPTSVVSLAPKTQTELLNRLSAYSFGSVA
jgi:hypothetical protein